MLLLLHFLIPNFFGFELAVQICALRVYHLQLIIVLINLSTIKGKPVQITQFNGSTRSTKHVETNVYSYVHLEGKKNIFK